MGYYVILEFLKNRIIILLLRLVIRSSYLWLKLHLSFTLKPTTALEVTSASGARRTVVELLGDWFRNAGCVRKSKYVRTWIRRRLRVINVSRRNILRLGTLGIQRRVPMTFLMKWLFRLQTSSQQLIYFVCTLLQWFFTFRPTVFWICCFCYFLKHCCQRWLFWFIILIVSFE